MVGKPVFRTRYDEIGASSAKFYFNAEQDAKDFAEHHSSKVEQTSPITAGGGLWLVDVPYNTAKIETMATVGGDDFNASIAAAIELGRVARATQPLPPPNEE